VKRSRSCADSRFSFCYSQMQAQVAAQCIDVSLTCCLCFLVSAYRKQMHEATACMPLMMIVYTGKAPDTGTPAHPPACHPCMTSALCCMHELGVTRLGCLLRPMLHACRRLPSRRRWGTS
jgi:hypothetical protein